MIDFKPFGLLKTIFISFKLEWMDGRICSHRLIYCEYATYSDSPSNSQMSLQQMFSLQSLMNNSSEDGSEVRNTSVLNGSPIRNCTSVQNCTGEQNSTRTECISSITINLFADPRNRKLNIFSTLQLSFFYHLLLNSVAILSYLEIIKPKRVGVRVTERARQDKVNS